MTEEGRAGPPARRFTEREVATILRRASLRDGDADLPSPHDPTLADLMAAASDVGLDPAEVRRAAALLPPPEPGVVETLLGAPDRRVCTAVLPGAPVPEARDALVRAAERMLGNRGQVLESDPDRFLWQETHLGGRSVVEITAVDGGARVEVRTDRAGHYLGYWFLGLLGWAGLSWLAPLALPPLPAFLAFLAVPPFLAHPLRHRADRRLRGRVEELVMELSRIVEAADPTAPGR